MLGEKIDALTAAQAAEAVPYVRPLDRPFPNLRVRELVREIVEGIVDTATHVKTMTAPEHYALALGMVRGARVTADNLGDDVSAPFLADLLDTLNRGGIEAVRRLVEVVTGRPTLDEAAAADFASDPIDTAQLEAA